VPLVNALLVHWQGGYHEVVDAASIVTYGRREAPLKLGAAQSVEEVEWVAARVFAQWATPAESLSVGHEPIGDDDVPFRDFGVADWITVDVEGVPTSARVRGLTLTEDSEGNPIYTEELGTLRQEHELRLTRWLQRMADGTIGGTNLSASPVSSAPASADTKTSRPDLEPFSYPGLLGIVESGGWPYESPYRLTRVLGTLRVAGSSTTTVRAKKNGVAVGDPITFAAGATRAAVDFAVDFAADVDLLSFEITAAGTGASDLVLDPRGI
jgi:hypothetical protein